MPALIGPIGTVVNMNQAVNGNALGNPAYAAALDVANQTGGQAAIIANYNASLASANATTLATTILNNMFVTTAAGVSAANVTALTSALSLALSSYPTAKGQVISNLANLLGALESDSSWGPAALAFNSQAAADYVYSTTLANTNAGVPSATATYTLTTGVDTFIGTSGNDLITAVFGSGATGAVAQRNTLTVPTPNGGTSVVVPLNYGGLTTNITSGTDATAYSAAITAAINQSAGSAIAVNTNATTVTITAATAGTALPGITFGAALTANNPTTAFTTANTPGSTGTGTTLNVTDTISMGAGTDTMALNVGGGAMALTAANSPLLSGVEILNLSNQGGAVSLVGTLAPNLTTLGLIGNATAAATTTVTAAAGTLNTLNLTNNTATGANVSITYDTATLAGLSDALTINMSGQQIPFGANNTTGNAADFSFVGADAGLATGFETVTINASGATNRIGSVTVTNSTPLSTMTTLNLVNNGTGTLRISDALVFKAGVAGSGLGVGTVTATGPSGVDILTGANTTLTFTGGAGNDTVRFAAAGDFTSADVVNLGGGSGNALWVGDTLINDTTTLALNALINGVTTAQRVGFSVATTGTGIDLSQITVPNIYTAAVAYTFTNVAATDFLNASGITTGAMTLTASVGFNTLNLNINATADAKGGFGTIAGTGQATINIASTSSGTQTAANTVGAVTNSANAVVNVTGTQDLTITSFSDSVGLNASTYTGVLTATGSNTASSFTGGSGADVLTGGTGADTFVGGAGNDTINTGVDGAIGTTITGGTGADAITLAHTTGAATTALNATSAESFATVGQFDTVTFAAAAAGGNTNTVTLTTGLTSSTVTAATTVVLGTTVVAAGSFLIVNTAGVATATTGNSSLYQDSNSNGIIDATDLQINFVAGDAADTMAVTAVGGKATIAYVGV